MVLGLFDNTGGKGIEKDFIDVTKLTKDRQQGAFGEIYWRRINPQFVLVDLNRFFVPNDPRNPGNPEHVCAYAAVTVTSQHATDAFLEIAGSDDHIQFWLNGRVLTPFPMIMSRNAKRRPISLNQGENLLVTKSCENVGSWFFTARITNQEGHDIDGITTTPEIPQQPIVPEVLNIDAQAIQLAEGYGEILQFKHSSETYEDYRDKGLSWWSSLRDHQSELVWQTAKVAEKKDTAFVFTASMSDEIGEAEFYINGRYAFSFPTGGPREVRSVKRGPYNFTFVSKAPKAGNSGIAILSVPAEDVEAGSSIEIRVVPTKGEQNPWFMVKNYKDTIAFEKMTPQLVLQSIQADWKSVEPAS